MPNARVRAAARGLPAKRKKQSKPSFVPAPDWLPPAENEVLYGIRVRTATRRQIVEATIERLIALLDHIDPDADLEPSLAGPPCRGSDDLEGPEDDLEPSLGAPDGCLDQRAWARGASDDCEATGTIEDMRASFGSFRSWSDRSILDETLRQLLTLARSVRHGRGAGKAKKIGFAVAEDLPF